MDNMKRLALAESTNDAVEVGARVVVSMHDVKFVAIYVSSDPAHCSHIPTPAPSRAPDTHSPCEFLMEPAEPAAADDVLFISAFCQPVGQIDQGALGPPYYLEGADEMEHARRIEHRVLLRNAP
jgi:hypothetical protein